MKKPLLLILIAMSSQVFCQISIDGSKIGIIDDKYEESTDTAVTGILITAPGPNQVWSYTNIDDDKNTTSVWQYVNWTPHASLFPSANLALKESTGKYFYYNKSSTAFQAEGGVGDIFDFGTSVDFVLDPTQKIANLPITYQDAFVDSSESEILGDTALTNLLPLGGVFDSARVRINIVTNVEVDGWGTITTPLGTFDALRIKTVSTISSQFGGGTVLPFVPTVWVNLFTNNDTVNQYTWWSDSLGASLLTLTANQNDVVEEATYLKSAPGPSNISEINKSVLDIYPNPSNEIINIQNYAGRANIRIYSLTGQVVLSKSLKQNQDQVELDFLDSGIYNIELIDSKGHTYFESIVIE